MSLADSRAAKGAMLMHCDRVHRDRGVGRWVGPALMLTLGLAAIFALTPAPTATAGGGAGYGADDTLGAGRAGSRGNTAPLLLVADLPADGPMQIRDFGGGVRPLDVRIGDCGWTSIWIYDRGAGWAKISAEAYSRLGPILSTSWTESWVNVSTLSGGSRSGGGPQFPNNWWRPDDWILYTRPGIVTATLTTFVATIYYNGVPAYCVGLRPSDTTVVTR